MINTKCLIVEDDDLYRARLARALNQRGLSCLEAHNCSEALLHAKAANPSHAIVDLRIGNENGLTLIRELFKVIPEIRLIILTGYGSIATSVEALKLGAFYYLTKPVDANRIYDALMGELAVQAAEPPYTPTLEQVEWDHIQRVVNDCNGNISHAAKSLGMHRRSLQRKLEKKPLRIA